MKHKISLFACIITVLAAVTTASTLAVAQSKSADLIKFRQSGMMFMRWNMGEIKKQVIKNPSSYNKDQVQAAANVIAAVANSGFGTLFTDATKNGKGWKKTRVKAEYFEQGDEVSKRAKTFIQEADRLAYVAQSGDVHKIADQFESVFKACKACHKKFRAKD